jgi:hypothetical protein
MQHSPLSASDTNRLFNCPGGVQATRDIQTPDSEFSAEGTLLHEIVERAVKEGRTVSDADFYGANGCLVDESELHDLKTTCQMFVDAVGEVRQNNQIVQEWVEERFIHPDLTDFGGTADYAAISFAPDGRVVCHIVDFKAGVGIAVYAPGNKQLLSYCALVASAFPLPIDEFRLTVVQPRNRDVDSIQKWACFAPRVKEHLNMVYQRSKENWFSAGPHCRFCPAAANCNILQDVVRDIKSVEDQEPTDERVAQWTEIHEMATVVRNTLTAIEEKLVKAAQNGVDLPGSKVVARKSHRKWTQPDTEILRLLADRGLFIDQAAETKLRTPASLEKFLKGSEKHDPDDFKELFSEHVDTKITGYKVVDAEAKGAPVDFHEFDPVVEELI